MTNTIFAQHGAQRPVWLGLEITQFHKGECKEMMFNMMLSGQRQWKSPGKCYHEDEIGFGAGALSLVQWEFPFFSFMKSSECAAIVILHRN